VRKIKASIIIPVRTATPYLKETISLLRQQSEKDFEIIVVTDRKEKISGVKVIASGEPTPAYKRNLGAKYSKGDILAFLDDDSYPSKDWLKNAKILFSDQSPIANHQLLSAICGPTLTPPNDNVFQRASGWVWASWLGSGAAGVYRNRISKRRYVDDFPSVNLLVRKKKFLEVGGFDINHWPGEDTKLCMDLVKDCGKIIYDPGVLVYHHRRSLFLPHLKQISRYALRRGHFAKIFPETSFRIGYFLPSVGAYGLLIGLFVSALYPLARHFYFLLFTFYFLLILLSGAEVYSKEKNFRLSLLTMLGIFLTHIVYGILFPFGFFQRKLKTTPHKIDSKRKVYIGG